MAERDLYNGGDTIRKLLNQGFQQDTVDVMIVSFTQKAFFFYWSEHLQYHHTSLYLLHSLKKGIVLLFSRAWVHIVYCLGHKMLLLFGSLLLAHLHNIVKQGTLLDNYPPRIVLPLSA